MTYLIVALFVIYRVFGFAKTLAFISKILATVLGGFESRNRHKSRKIAKPAKSFSKQPVQSSPWVATENARQAPTRDRVYLGDADDKKLAIKAKASPRLVQNSGRSSEEILMGKPDFGWRRNY